MVQEISDLTWHSAPTQSAPLRFRLTGCILSVVLSVERPRDARRNARRACYPQPKDRER
jgi:hypothetical protein